MYDSEYESHRPTPEGADGPGRAAGTHPVSKAVIRRQAAPVAPGGDLLGAPLPVEPASPAAEKSLRSVLKYRKTILLMTLLIVLPALAGIWGFTRPLYRATGQVRVRPIIPHLVFPGEGNGPIPYYQDYLNTQVAVILSPTVLQRALARPEVQGTAWFEEAGQGWPWTSESKLEALQRQLTVRTRPRTEIIDVFIETPSGKDSAIVVDAVLAEYLHYAGEMDDAGSSRIYQQLVEQHDRLREMKREKEQEIRALERDLGTTDPEKLVAQMRWQLQDTQGQVDRLTRSEAVARWRLERMQGQRPVSATDGNAAPAAVSAGALFESDPEWQRRRAEVDMIDMEITLKRKSIGASHPEMRDLLTRKGLLETRVREREEAMRRRGPFAALPNEPTVTVHAFSEPDAARLDAELIEYERTLAAESLQNLRQSWAQTFEGTQVLAAKLVELQEVSDLFEAVKDRLVRKRMERNVPGSIEILAHAVPPLAPSTDRRAIFSLLSVFGGLMTGLVVAYLRAGAERPMIEAHELGTTTPAPFLGRLPQVAAGKALPLHDPLLIEGVRMVRTSLLQRIDRGEGNVVLVTSAGPREGKTTVTIMLARSLASCGRRVLLVDGDLRRPRIAASLGLNVRLGILDTLLDEGKDREAIVQSDTPGLWVLPSRPAADGYDSEILAGQGFAQAVQRWSEGYDVVLLDSPPVLAAADAQILARQANGTLLLARAEQTRRDDMIEALSYLASAGGNLWGTVFVAARSDRGGAYYSYAERAGGA